MFIKCKVSGGNKHEALLKLMNMIKNVKTISDSTEIKEFIYELTGESYIKYCDLPDAEFYTKKGCMAMYVYLNIINNITKHDIVWSYDYIPMYMKNKIMYYYNTSINEIQFISMNILLPSLYITGNERSTGNLLSQQLNEHEIEEDELYINRNNYEYVIQLMSSKKKLVDNITSYGEFFINLGIACISISAVLICVNLYLPKNEDGEKEGLLMKAYNNINLSIFGSSYNQR